MEKKKPKAKVGFIEYVVREIQKEKLQTFRNRPYFKTIVTEVKGKPRGKENLKKVKFPCFCKFGIYRNIGILNANRETSKDKIRYRLYTIDQSSMNGVASNFSLKEMIDKYDIEILKGELHLWKEVK